MTILAHPDEAFGNSLSGKILPWQSAWRDLSSAKLMFGFSCHLLLAVLLPSVVLAEKPFCQPGLRRPVALRALGALGPPAQPGEELQGRLLLQALAIETGAAFSRRGLNRLSA